MVLLLMTTIGTFKLRYFCSLVANRLLQRLQGLLQLCDGLLALIELGLEAFVNFLVVIHLLYFTF